MKIKLSVKRHSQDLRRVGVGVDLDHSHREVHPTIITPPVSGPAQTGESCTDSPKTLEESRLNVPRTTLSNVPFFLKVLRKKPV